MADSFFGFDTTLPDESRGNRDTIDFDALNDETFNQAITGDWENHHESLVRNELSIDKSGSEEEFDSDLDINDFITKFDSTIDIRNDETDTRHQFQLDPGVWTTPIKPATPQKIHQKFPGPPPGIPPQPQPSVQQNSFPFVLVSHQQPHQPQSPAQQQQQPSAAPKIMSLEEIERSIISQQQQLQHQKQMQEKLAALAKMTAQSPVPPPSQVPQSQQIAPQQQVRKALPNQQQQPVPQQNPPQPQPGIIFPPSGFPPIPPHLQGPNFNAKFNPLIHPMMNNFHPNFPGGLPMPRPGMPAQMNRLPPHLINMQANPMMYHNQPQNAAQFNQRLVQEIQQNHPLLNHAFNAQQRQQQQMHHNNNNNRHQKYNNHMNGKPDDFDEYANLMSNRDKQFLITIQLMQLNTETPYFDDYYYTMFKERMRSKGADKESQAHRDNQMNHPFTQPKGHAQMLLRQFNNISKNGFQNQKNGMGRERRNSESSQKNEKEPPTPRTYIPLQFENSLGKLQCGSVTAPRKIIDMEIVAMAEIGNQNSPAEFTLQKKSRQIMMHIETLYKIVLKLEDFHNPMAIAATVILKEKREKQRLQMELERKTDEDDSSTKSSISINELETQTDLMIKLLSMIPTDKIPGMMTARKGRTLLKRIMALLKNQPVRWEIWNAIFLSLTVFKRDKLEEIEASLMPLYFEFAIQLQDADFIDLLKISNNMMTSEKLLSYLNGCKFFVSSIIAMFIKGELIFQRAGDMINFHEEEQWVEFLNKLSTVVMNDRTVDAQILNSANNVNRDKSDNEPIIRTVMDHLQRFKGKLTCDEQKLVKLLGIQFDLK